MDILLKGFIIINYTMDMKHKGVVFNVSSNEEFYELLENSKKFNVTVFIKYTAVWCKPCKKIQPLYQTLAAKYPDFVFCCVDVDELEDVYSEYNITSMPTFSMVKNGNYVELFKGANQSKLVEVVANENKR